MMEREWRIEERMPAYDDVREFEVWVRNGSTRTVRRAGNMGPWTPGVLIYTDSRHPMSNAICNEDDVVGWRHTGRKMPALSRNPLEECGFVRKLLGFQAVRETRFSPILTVS